MVGDQSMLHTGHRAVKTPTVTQLGSRKSWDLNLGSEGWESKAQFIRPRSFLARVRGGRSLSREGPTSSLEDRYITSEVRARVLQVGRAAAMSFLHPPQSPVPYSDTPGWLEQQTGNGEERGV